MECLILSSLVPRSAKKRLRKEAGTMTLPRVLRDNFLFFVFRQSP